MDVSPFGPWNRVNVNAGLPCCCVRQTRRSCQLRQKNGDRNIEERSFFCPHLSSKVRTELRVTSPLNTNILQIASASSSKEPFLNYSMLLVREPLVHERPRQPRLSCSQRWSDSVLLMVYITSAVKDRSERGTIAKNWFKGRKWKQRIQVPSARRIGAAARFQKFR